MRRWRSEHEVTKFWRAASLPPMHRSQHPSMLLDVMLTLAVVVIGVFLVVYMLHSA